jgi:hypothetical protein
LYQDYNLYGFPTCFFDGGYEVLLGGYTGQTVYRNSIESCGQRPVPDIDLNVTVEWLGDATILVNITIQNNEAETYTGRLRVFIVEPISRWNNAQGDPYDFAFLDWAINTDIELVPDEVFEDTTTWDGNQNGFSDITRNNIMVIAAVFNSEEHVGYSDPPENLHPFEAYWADQTAGDIPLFTTEPPLPPEINGTTNGRAGVEYDYTFVTTDPDDDDVYYYIDWDDGQVEEWIGTFESGEEITVSHTWDEKGEYVIKAKAKDILEAGSDWGTLEVEMPYNSFTIESFLQKLVERFPRVFLFLQNL